MNIEEVQEKRIRLEKQITLLILKYEQKTGTKVSEINIQRYFTEERDGYRMTFYGDFDVSIGVKI